MNNNENLIEVPEFRAKKIDSDEYVIGYLFIFLLFTTAVIDMNILNI